MIFRNLLKSTAFGLKPALALTALTMSLLAGGAEAKLTVKYDAGAPKKALPAPSAEESAFVTVEQLNKFASEVKEESKRSPSGRRTESQVATEDLLSPEFKAFRDELIKARTGEQFAAIIARYNSADPNDTEDKLFKAIPERANDLKYTVARLSTWVPLRGIVWRMTPLIHNVVVTQEALLASLRNVAEQVKINLPDSHVEAQMLFLTMPSSEIKSMQFKNETEFIDYLATDVYRALGKAVQRLGSLAMYNKQEGGKMSPLVFDARIRFGEQSFKDNAVYNAADRFKFISSGEKFAAMARYHRRMFGIASIAGYNWNGHLALRREIGLKLGMGAAEDALFELKNEDQGMFVRGATRKDRRSTIMSHTNLYKIRPGGNVWMKTAYGHLQSSAKLLNQAWQVLQHEDRDTVMQIDPEVFMARKEQVQSGVDNMLKLTSANWDDSAANSTVTITGALSGTEVKVNMKEFFKNPPGDMKDLLPTGFAGNEDLERMNKLPGYESLRAVSSEGSVMQIKYGKDTVYFRNYLYGRATSWNTTSKGYGNLLPGRSGPEVATAMRVINETRGARILGNGITAFIR